MRPFEAIIFDLGSTLIYFEGDWSEIMYRASKVLYQQLDQAGLKLDQKHFLREYHQAVNAYYQERESEFIEHTTHFILRNLLAEWGYPEVPDQILRHALKAMYAVSQSHWHPEPDAVPILKALQERGYRLGLISNAADDKDVQTLVDKAEIRSFFDKILTSAGEGIRKPNPQIFQKLLDYWDLLPTQAAMVGDTLGADILGAKNAGIFSIWITRRADTPANHAHGDTIHPDATIDALNELPGLLDQLAVQ
jgi:2-haloalkanoic acid dehalogenase type II